MTDLEKRSLARRDKIKVNIVNLHDETKHHSFHPELNTTDAWNLLYAMSIKHYEETTGKKVSTKVDKTKVRIITLNERFDDALN